MFAELPYPILPLVVVLHGLGHGGALAALAWIAAATGLEHRRLDGGPLVAGSGHGPGRRDGRGGRVLARVARPVRGRRAGHGGDRRSPMRGDRSPRPAAVVSLAGIGLFLGTWPAFNTIAAVAVNVGILVLLATSR